jgi:hypothetical protein
LVYGWIISPVEYINASPERLRSDYKTDYVLMVAEIYQADGDLQQAILRLASLGSQPAAESAAEALSTAQELEYSDADIATMTRLVDALQDRTIPNASGDADE